MNVKSLLRELIKDGSGQAMPGIKVVNIDNSAPTYVAPADGYARFSCRANGVNDWWVVSTPENNLEGGFAAPGASHQQAPWIPVKKGATISFSTSEGVPVTSKLFIYSVGRGGKSPVAQLFWRVVPCLRNCLMRALTPIADRTRVSSQVAILQLTSRSRQGMRILTQTLTFLRATACSSSSVSPLKATPTTTSRFDEISSTVDSLGATGRRGRFLRLLAERAKRFTGTHGLVEPLRTLRRTSAFTHTSALNVCFGGASYE